MTENVIKLYDSKYNSTTTERGLDLWYQNT